MSFQFAISGRLPEPSLVAVLNLAGFDPGLALWIDASLEPGPYTHYTVGLQQRGSRNVLSIDTFLLDPWVNSKTGETGESPHGSCKEFTVDVSGNVVNHGEVVDVDGDVTEWTSSSISFYGG